MSGFNALPRTTAVVASSHAQQSVEMSLTRLPADVRRRWEETRQALWARDCVMRWAEQAPTAMAGLTSVAQVDAHIGQLWLQRRGDEMDEVLRVLVAAVSDGGQGGELAFLVLVRRLALVVVKLAERYGLGVSSVVASLWLLVADYPLHRRPHRIALNLRLDLQKGVRRDALEATRGTDLRGLGEDVEVLLRQDSQQRFVEVAGRVDPSWVVESSQCLSADPIAAVYASPLPAADLTDGLLQWAGQVVPAADIELLRMVFATGTPRRTPLDDVARHLGLSPEATRQRLQRSIKRLSQAVVAVSAPSGEPTCTWSACRLHANQRDLQAA